MFPSRFVVAFTGQQSRHHIQTSVADSCVILIVFIHLMDTAMTALLASTVGLWEANPIAVAIATHTDSLEALLLYKCIMSLPAICVLIVFRNNRAFRLVLIGVLAASVALAFHWLLYVDLITSVDFVELHQDGKEYQNFIRFP